jgi:NitT/TauT family transport system ATP-binding protein
MQCSRRIGTEEINRRAEKYTEKVGLKKFQDIHPHMLSGGMKMRVAIARAMAMEPDVLLMDEPFAALDALTRRKMQNELLQLWDDIRFTVIFVTHSIEEAVLIGNRIVVLSPHPGQVKAELNSHQHGFNDLQADKFVALQQRITDMLFAEQVETMEVKSNEH